MKKKYYFLLFFSIFSLCISTKVLSQRERIAPLYNSSNNFLDQFNQLDYIAFWLYDMKYQGWREDFANPEIGPKTADVYQAWGTFYFPYKKGGMTTRWQTNSSLKKTPTLSSLNWDTIKQMSEVNRNMLSPCEKADIFFGNKDFRITKHELYWRGPLRGTGPTARLFPSTSDHEGFCNGARAAGALTPEPINKISLPSLADPSIKVTFFPLDIKMLSTISYFHLDRNGYAMIGDIMNDGTDLDVHPGILDIALRSLIGVKGKSFFMDADPNPGVPVNVSVIGYNRALSNSQLTESDKLNNPLAVKKLTIDLSLYYLGEVSAILAKAPTSAAIKDHSKFVTTKKCNYYLLISNDGKIINSYWGTNSFKPDNIWFADGLGADEVYYNNSSISGADNSTIRLGNPYLPSIFTYNLIIQSTKN